MSDLSVLWLTAVDTMPELKEIVSNVLLPLQLTLGLFLIMKTTPLWAVIHCTLASFLNFFHFPCTDYKHLNGFKGRVFKKVISHTTTAGNVSKVKKHKSTEKSKQEGKSENDNRASVVYLGQKFVLERNDENQMFMEAGPAYFITDNMWATVKYIEKVAPKTVFVKDHKEIWEEVVTGDIMEFEEVLDSVILDNRAVIRLDHDYFLPVNLLLSEDKLMTVLNFVGLFLKTQRHIHWLIPTSLSFTAAVMGFSAKLRLHIDGFINKIFCRSVQFLCDMLPLGTRRRVYFWGNWVGNLKPSNDLQSKIVSGHMYVLVFAGAKAESGIGTLAKSEPLGISRDYIREPSAKSQFETSVDLKSLVNLGKLDALLSEHARAQLHAFVDPESLSNLELLHEIWCKGGQFLFKCDSSCGLLCSSTCDSIYIEWVFNGASRICSLKAGRVAEQELLICHDIYIVCNDVDDDCRRAEDAELLTCYYCCGKEAHDKSVIADNIDVASVDVECNTEEEAKKLLLFACYMAKYKSGSLKLYDRNTNKVYVRRFVESINAYVRSKYPPLYRLYMKDVVVC